MMTTAKFNFSIRPGPGINIGWRAYRSTTWKGTRHVEIRRAVAGKVPPRTEITVKLDFLGRGRGRRFHFRGAGQLTSTQSRKKPGRRKKRMGARIRLLRIAVSCSARRKGWEKNNVRDVVKGVAPRDRETRRKWRIDEIRDIGGNLLPEIYFPLHAPRLVCLVS